MMLRILQITIGLSIVPMMCLGLMASLSGGGTNPAFQRIGGQLTSLSPIVGVICLIVSWLLQRSGRPRMAYVILVIPLIIWGFLIFQLHRETGFFSV